MDTLFVNADILVDETPAAVLDVNGLDECLMVSVVLGIIGVVFTGGSVPAMVVSVIYFLSSSFLALNCHKNEQKKVFT